MDTAIKLIKLFTFLIILSAAFVALQFLGQGQKALETLGKSLSDQLHFILAWAVAAAGAILIPTTRKQIPSSPPDLPTDLTYGIISDPPPLPPAGDDRVIQELSEWRNYGVAAQNHIQELTKAREQLDTRQAVLRISVYGIVGLAVLFSAAGFLAPLMSNPQNPAITETVLLKHFEYMSGAFAIVGLVLGAIIYRIDVTTTPKSAWRCALISASVFAAVITFTSLPYIIPRMWNQQVAALDLNLPVVIWVCTFRVIVAPVICSVCGYVGFNIVSLLTRPQPPSSAGD